MGNPGLRDDWESCNSPAGLADLRLLSVTTYAYLPNGFGGSALSTHDMCLSFLKKGLRPTVLARADRRLTRALRRDGKKDVLDQTLGYDIVRATDPVNRIESVVEAFTPTVAVVQSGRQIECARRLIALGIPTTIYVRDVEFDRLNGPFFNHPLLRYFANSTFTAQAVWHAFRIDCDVIPPLVRRESYATESQRTHVVFINPVRQKGVATVTALARHLPHRNFLIVECWPLSRWQRLKLWFALRALRNVTWLPSTLDMRDVYRWARLVIVPSRWREAWCRVATEAHCSAIPVIATDIGGLPESVGSGGMLIDPDAGVSEWGNAVELLWNDSGAYAGYVAAARAFSDRPEIDENYLTEKLLAKFLAQQNSAATAG
jgi:glycosyltransferase involved in cell wall biosynthesis